MRDSFARFFWKADERDALRRDPALLEADESDELRRDPALLEAEERELRRDRALLEAEERDELRRAMLEADHHDALDPQPDEPPRDEQWRASDQTALDQPSENLYRELSSFNTENSQDRQSNHDYDIPNNTKYHHPNLRTTDKHIRLLELLPLTPDGMINCKFHYYKLGECPSFTAISYTWGEALPTHTINVNMFDVVVRENLWQFLRQMDAQQVRRLFWIDALCINQGSTEEKNHQVALMWEIYAQVRTFWYTEDAVSAYLSDEIRHPKFSSGWVLHPQTAILQSEPSEHPLCSIITITITILFSLTSPRTR
jgi:hypothetical protein